MSLEKLVLFGHEGDRIVKPWCSAWFCVFKEGTTEIIQFEDRYEYQ